MPHGFLSLVAASLVPLLSQFDFRNAALMAGMLVLLGVILWLMTAAKA